MVSEKIFARRARSAKLTSQSSVPRSEFQAFKCTKHQNIVKRNMKVKICMHYGRRRKPAATSKRPLGGDGVGTPSRALEHTHSFSRTRAHPQKKPSTSCHMRSYHQARERQSRARRGRADYMTNKSRRSISERAVNLRDVQRGRFAARLQALGYF